MFVPNSTSRPPADMVRIDFLFTLQPRLLRDVELTAESHC